MNELTTDDFEYEPRPPVAHFGLTWVQLASLAIGLALVVAIIVVVALGEDGDDESTPSAETTTTATEAPDRAGWLS